MHTHTVPTPKKHTAILHNAIGICEIANTF